MLSTWVSIFGLLYVHWVVTFTGRIDWCQGWHCFSFLFMSMLRGILIQKLEPSRWRIGELVVMVVV